MANTLPKYQMVDPDSARTHKTLDSHDHALNVIVKLVAENKELKEDNKRLKEWIKYIERHDPNH